MLRTALLFVRRAVRLVYAELPRAGSGLLAEAGTTAGWVIVSLAGDRIAERLVRRAPPRWIAAASGGGVGGSSRFGRYCALATSDKRASTATAGVATGQRPPAAWVCINTPTHRGVGGAGPRRGVGDLLVGERRQAPPTRCYSTNRPAPQRSTSSRSTSPMPTPRPSPRRPRPASAASCRKPSRARRAGKPSTGPTCTAVRSPSRSATNSACAVRWLC